MHPVPYPITTPYGQPGSWAAGYHTGADYACPTGTAVKAAVGGRCVQNGWDDSYGYLIEIETDGIRHRYCHLREPGIIWPGMECHEGTVVGWSGSTGNSTGPHVHYEERTAPYGYWDHRPPLFNTKPQQPQPAPLPDIEEAEAMLLQRNSDKKGVLITGGQAIWVTSGSDYSAMKAGGLPAAIVSDSFFGDVIEAMGGAS